MSIVHSVEPIPTPLRLTDMEHRTAAPHGQVRGPERDEFPGANRRPRRRRRLLTLTAALTVAMVGVAVGLATGSDRDQTRGITSAADPTPSTTVAGEPATTVADGARPAPTDPPAPAPKPTTTTAPPPGVGLDRSRPVGMRYAPQAVWPETVAELDRLQAAVDQGHEPWRNDPVEVARAYLLDRGLPGPGMGPSRSTAAGAGSVDYTVAGMAGRVDLQRLLNGSIWYVAGSRTATFPGVRVDRGGASLVVVVQSGADGTMKARTKRPGGPWGADHNLQAFTGGTRTITLESGETSGEVILQLRLEGDGKAGVADIYLGHGADAVRYSAVDSESRLRVDGLGPVRIGMSLEGARAASGLPMVYGEASACVGYRTDAPPAGVGFTSVERSQRLDFIDVSEPSIATVSGIRVGSTLTDVRRAYGDKAQGSVQEGWGKLVVRPDDRSRDHLALALLFSEGKVAGMWAGLRVVVEADEVCA